MKDMLEIKSFYQEYLDGIKRARDSGHIVYSGSNLLGPRDDYAHLKDKPSKYGYDGELIAQNTRHLSHYARQILEHVLRDGFRFIEFGPGAGIACSDASKIAENAGKSIEIYTVSLTPINPFCRLKYSQTELATMGIDKESISIGELELTGVVDMLDHPYIQRQYIGRFPEDIQPPHGHYDMAYDNLGAIYYTMPGDSLLHAFRSLKKDGIMILSQPTLVKIPDDVGSLLERNATVIKIRGIPDHLLIFASHNKLLEKLKKYMKIEAFTEANESFEDILKKALEDLKLYSK